MYRTVLGIVSAAVIAVAALWAHHAVSTAGPAKAAPEPPAAGGKEALASSALPITQISLFSSGVGHVVRQGVVTDNARLDLTLPVGDINDLLKSLVARDQDGGVVRAATCDSHDPVAKVLRGFALNLADNPPLAALLNQARGEPVEVTLAPGAGAALSGDIMGVEKQRRQVGKTETVEVEVLNLWCRDGLRSVKLTDVQRLNFASPTLRDELKQALGVLTRAHDNRLKVISLTCTGEGKRRVQVGYVVEHPLWKTTYRLRLDKEKLGLEGWALVENPSAEDWRNIRLALVVGRPVSFRMDLYQPLYVPRPLVELDLFAGLRPPTYNGPLDTWMERAQQKSGRPDAPAAAPAAPPAPPAKAAAQGDFFEYVIDGPVNLPRQKSALFPIVRKDLAGQPLSVYNEAKEPRFPMLSVRLKNVTGLHLEQGPITVYEGDSYAGDALLPRFQPNEERLIGYAVDLGTEIKAEARKSAEALTMVRINRGMLTTTKKLRDAKAYRIRNRSTQERSVLIEHPTRPDYRLTGALKPSETTRDHYRFEIEVRAGMSAIVEVVEEKDLAQDVQLTGSDDRTIRLYLSSEVSSPALKAALQQVVALQGKVAEGRRELELTEQQLTELVEDQKRLRDNMARVPESSNVYKGYLKKLEEQEGRIETLQEGRKRLRREVAQRQKAVEDYLSGLKVE